MLFVWIAIDTYFNSFSIGKWKKYTRIKNVYITLKFTGKMRITLIRKERQGKEVLTHYIKEKIIESSGEEVTICFNDPYCTGIYTIDLFAVTNSIFYGGYYWTDIDEKDIDSGSIALDICTFKREHFIKKNIGLIKKKIFESNNYDFFKKKIEIFIIDNGNSLVPEEFPEKYIHLIHNKNVGGAGGFTRGLIEIKKKSKILGITHALLMDDDIVVEPESIYRTWCLLSILKTEYKEAFVGGAMLRLDHQNIQVECGAIWNRGELLGRKAGLDLRGVAPCLYTEVEESIEYTAWWYTALQLSVVREDNLPIPIFIRGDDVEYGMRNARRIITMNSICVWHEPFENKYSSTTFYYILRNRLIDNAIHGVNMSKKELIRELERQVLSEVYLYRYKNARLLLRGVVDYLAGIDWLKTKKGEDIHNSLLNDGYKMQYLEDIQGYFDYGLFEQLFLTS